LILSLTSLPTAD